MDAVPAPSPSVSIVIPCLNEERYIGVCLDAMLANDLDKENLEIFVVDGMSTDRTREIIQGYSERHPFIKLLDNPQKLKPIALNLGIGASESDIVIRIDAHSTYAPDYLSKLVSGLFEFEADNIGGIRLTENDRSLLSIAASEAISHPFGAGDAKYRTGVGVDGPTEVDTVFCGCYRREVFEKIGLFNEALVRAQDKEFNHRLRAAGGRIILDPTIRCSYFPRSAPRAYARWSFAGGYWTFYANRFCDTPMFTLRAYVPVAFVVWHAVTAGLLVVAPPVGAVAALPIGLYWGLNLAVSLGIARKHRKAGLMLAMPLFFGLTHYAYGVGGVVGRARYVLQGGRQK